VQVCHQPPPGRCRQMDPPPALLLPLSVHSVLQTPSGSNAELFACYGQLTSCAAPARGIGGAVRTLEGRAFLLRDFSFRECRRFLRIGRG
jgi:hypothetical protein